MHLFGNGKYSLDDILNDKEGARSAFLNSILVFPMSRDIPVKEKYAGPQKFYKNYTVKTVLVYPEKASYPWLHFGPEFAEWLREGKDRPQWLIDQLDKVKSGQLRLPIYFYTTREWLEVNKVDFDSIFKGISEDVALNILTAMKKRAELGAIIAGFDVNIEAHRDPKLFGIFPGASLSVKTPVFCFSGLYDNERGATFYPVFTLSKPGLENYSPLVVPPSVVEELKVYHSAKEAFDAYQKSVSQAAAPTS